jgi:hypothetical protein
MQAAAARLGDYTLVESKRERFGDRLSPVEILQLKHSRGRIYLHVVDGPRRGAEAIWAPGWNGGKVRVHKGSFPDVTVNLDPHGAMMMSGQHHPIEHATLGYAVAGLLENVRRSEGDAGRHMRWLGEARVAGRAADLVELSIPWRTRRHVVDGGEDAWTLGRRFGVEPYMVAHTNGVAKLDGFSDGQQIVVPLYGASRALLSIDRASHLPSRLELYDGAGQLYEQYEWTRLDTSPLTDGDFDPHNQFYAF